MPDARLVGTGGAALVLFLLVAAFARDAGGADERARSESGTYVFPFLSAGGMVLIGATFIALLVAGARRPRRAVGALLLAGLVGVAALWAVSGLSGGRADVRDEAVEPPPPPARAARPAAEDWVPTGAALLVAVAGLAAVALLVSRRPGTHAEVEPDDEGSAQPGAVARALASRLGDLIDELRDDPDPGRAVIRAWARLEALLAEHQLPRPPSELTSAYVQRALVHLQTSGAAVRGLAVSFERAMYSPHPIGRSEQVAAVDALVAVRDDLAVRA